MFPSKFFRLSALSVFVFIAALLTAVPTQASDALSEGERQDVIKLIRETLTKNPEIVMEALEELQRRREVAEAAQKRVILAHSKATIYDDPLTPIAGNPKGDVSLVEFFDYRCGYCKRVFPAVMALVKKDKNLRYVIKEYPILGKESVFASRAALAAKVQDKYFEMHVALMEAPGSLSNSKVMSIAQSIGLDMDKLKTDMESPEVRLALQKNYQLAQSLDITGTPAFIIGDNVVPGAIGLERLEAMVAEAREKKN